MSQTVFIVDTYCPYDKNKDVRRIFNYNNREYCVREVGMDWGIVQVQLPVDDSSDIATAFKVYDTMDEANEFVDNLLGAKL